MRVLCGSTAPANLATSGAVPTDFSETEIPNDTLMYYPCQDGREVFFDGFGG
jgi:hypothetical protein